MFSFLKNIFKRKKSGKYFQFMICDSTKEIPLNKWYRLRRWQRPNYLKMETDWTKDWKTFSTEETVVGVTRDSREVDFLLMGDQDDFKIFLEREKDNPVDPNAIKVMASATVEGRSMVRQLGYLPKETAGKLKDEKDINARLHSVFLPYEKKKYGLRVRVLVRSAKYKKKMKKAHNG
jgi:hypothetical protein